MFQIPRQADIWFRGVSDEFEVKFDIYYLCAMYGLRTQTKPTPESAETQDLIDSFPGPYSEKGKLIVASLLRTELDVNGVDVNDRAAVHRMVREMVSPKSSAYLTKEGFRTLNNYCNGGFELLKQNYQGDRPRNLEAFLLNYRELINRE